MKINEIFFSLQGEGIWIGRPNIFIRTTGCNLRCSYCDTKYAYFSGKEINSNDILRTIEKYQCKHVCITGGEPLLQNEIYDLIDLLIKNNFFICIETNGSIDIKDISKKNEIMISLDIKCPSSKMDDKNRFENLKYLRKNDQVKFIIKNRIDYLYAKKIYNQYNPDCYIFFQPVWKSDSKKLAEWILYDKLNVRLGFQLQKILWGDKRKK